jgi:hypothetical protein
MFSCWWPVSTADKRAVRSRDCSLPLFYQPYFWSSAEHRTLSASLTSLLSFQIIDLLLLLTFHYSMFSYIRPRFIRTDVTFAVQLFGSVILPLVTFDVQFFHPSVIRRSVFLPLVIRRSVSCCSVIRRSASRHSVTRSFMCVGGSTVTRATAGRRRVPESLVTLPRLPPLELGRRRWRQAGCEGRRVAAQVVDW